jgi:hypothetical protein
VDNDGAEVGVNDTHSNRYNKEKLISNSRVEVVLPKHANIYYRLYNLGQKYQAPSAS